MYIWTIPPFLKFCTRKAEKEIFKEYQAYLIKMHDLVIPNIINKTVSTINI